MHYFNVSIYVEKNEIKIRLEKISEVGDVQKAQAEYLDLNSPTSFDFIENEISINYPVFLAAKDPTIQTTHPTAFFKAKLYETLSVKFEEKDYQLESYHYVLPTDTQKALGLISILDYFEDSSGSVSIQDESIEKYIIDNKLNKSLGAFFDNIKKHLLGYLEHEPTTLLSHSTNEFWQKHCVVYKFLKLTNIPLPHQSLIKNLQDIWSYGPFLNKELNFYNYFTNDFLNQLIATQKNPRLLIDPSVSESEKKIFLDQIKKDLYTENKVFDWENTFNMLKEKAIVDLYTPCLTQKAHDGNPYHYRHTELQFLRNIVLILPSNNKMRATNFHNNTAYQEWYAPKRQYHDKFAPELRHLFTLIGLELEKCDHEGIIFTENATKKLIPLGLHLLNKNNLSLYTSQRLFAVSSNESSTDTTTKKDLQTLPLNSMEIDDTQNAILRPSYN